MSNVKKTRAKQRRSRGQPRKGQEKREVYSIRLEPDTAQKAAKLAGSLSNAVNAALEEYLKKTHPKSRVRKSCFYCGSTDPENVHTSECPAIGDE